MDEEDMPKAPSQKGTRDTTGVYTDYLRPTNLPPKLRNLKQFHLFIISYWFLWVIVSQRA